MSRTQEDILHGADADTNHVLGKMNIKTTQQKIKGKKMQEKWNYNKLKNKTIQESFEAEVASKLDKECKHKPIQDRWKALRENILDSAKKNIGIIKQVRAKKSWITGEMIDKMEERRKWKSVNTEAGR